MIDLTNEAADTVEHGTDDETRPILAGHYPADALAIGRRMAEPAAGNRDGTGDATPPRAEGMRSEVSEAT